MITYIRSYLMVINKIIISPHFDDACLSAFAELDDKSLVVAIFSGFPKIEQKTDWDIFCGFKNSTEAVSKRAKENETASKYIGFKTIDLGFIDWQYNQAINKGNINREIMKVIKRHPSATIFCPLSFGVSIEHPDHILMTEIILEVSSDLKSTLFFYADLPYQINRKLDWVKIENKEKKISTCKIYKSQLSSLFETFPGFNYSSLANEAYLTLKEALNLRERAKVLNHHLDSSHSK